MIKWMQEVLTSYLYKSCSYFYFQVFTITTLTMAMLQTSKRFMKYPTMLPIPRIHFPVCWTPPSDFFLAAKIFHVLKESGTFSDSLGRPLAKPSSKLVHRVDFLGGGNPIVFGGPGYKFITLVKIGKNQFFKHNFPKKIRWGGGARGGLPPP